MIEIECPKCHTVFTEDESKFAGIIQQVRDKEFAKEVDQRTRLMERERDSAVDQARTQALAQAREEAQREAAKRDEVIASLREQLAAQQAQAKAAQDAHELDLRAQRQQLEVAAHDKDARIAQLEQEASSRQEVFESQLQLAVGQARAQVERERDEQAHKAQLAEAERKRLADALEEQRRESARQLEQTIEAKNKELEDYKALQSKLTTKLVGESLERHCETEFNRWRPAFPTATFEKDNEVVAGSKGDFVFRDFDEDGTEFLSVMFEMKNEEEQSQARNRHRNADFFDKLDRDRRNKGCEYAVLVTTLEADSDFYNQGIVDVSSMSGHEKMYAIRPQFFIPLLTFLQSVARESVKYRQEVDRLQKESVDVANFNRALGEFKAGFGRDYEHAAKKLEDAIEGIDKTIAQLERIRESFRLTETHLARADKKVEALTIKRLTKESPRLEERFEALGRDDSGEPVDPDEVEVEGAEGTDVPVPGQD